jgi:hypothetical protein
VWPQERLFSGGGAHWRLGSLHSMRYEGGFVRPFCLCHSRHVAHPQQVQTNRLLERWNSVLMAIPVVVWTSSTCGSIISPSFVYLDIENNADASRAALGLVFSFELRG